MRKHRLFTPGPTPIPPDAQAAMAQPIDYHRAEPFMALVREVQADLQYILETRWPVAVLAATGTGAMECALVNCFSPGDAVLAIQSGKFGERWVELAQAFGLQVQVLDLEWGQSVDPEAVGRALRQDPSLRGVLATLCETSTGALHDIQALAAIVRETPALLIVDAVSALGADRLRMDPWDVDVIVSCSQKGLMTPPGLGFCAVGPRAQEAMTTATLPRYYWDLRRYLASLDKDTTPFTPAVALWYGLREALRMIRQEGREKVWARHARMAAATRAAVKALGLDLFPEYPANTLTAIRLPKELDGRALVRHLRERYGAVFAGGQAHLAGKIVRIAHLGWMDDFDALTAVAALERALDDLGYTVPVGEGVAAAQRVLAEPFDDDN